MWGKPVWEVEAERFLNAGLIQGLPLSAFFRGWTVTASVGVRDAPFHCGLRLCLSVRLPVSLSATEALALVALSLSVSFSPLLGLLLFISLLAVSLPLSLYLLSVPLRLFLGLCASPLSLCPSLSLSL